MSVCWALFYGILGRLAPKTSLLSDYLVTTKKKNVYRFKLTGKKTTLKKKKKK